MKKNWELYSHTADMGIRGFGDTMAQAFESAATALVAVNVDPEKIEQKQKIEVTCHEQDKELLFIAWLNSLIYEMATRKMFFSKFQVTIKNGELTGYAWGEKLDLKKHKPGRRDKRNFLLRPESNAGKWKMDCAMYSRYLEPLTKRLDCHSERSEESGSRIIISFTNSYSPARCFISFSMTLSLN